MNSHHRGPSASKWGPGPGTHNSGIQHFEQGGAGRGRGTPSAQADLHPGDLLLLACEVIQSTPTQVGLEDVQRREISPSQKDKCWRDPERSNSWRQAEWGRAEAGGEELVFNGGRVSGCQDEGSVVTVLPQCDCA